MNPEFDLVVVRTFDNYFNAHIALTRLEAEGFQAFLRDEQTVTIDPILTNAIGGIKLEVLRADAEQVMQLLDSVAAQDICPNCGAPGMVRVPKTSVANWAIALLSWAFSSYAVAPDQEWCCRVCDYRKG